MSNTPHFETTIRPPPGVSFTQWGDGTIKIRYSTRDVLPIRKMLLDLARNLTNEALEKLKADKQVELERQRLPLTRLQTINQEMQTLQTEMKGIETETLDLSVLRAGHELRSLQNTIEERIKAVEIEPVDRIENAPGVSVSTTVDVAEFED